MQCLRDDWEMGCYGAQFLRAMEWSILGNIVGPFLWCKCRFLKFNFRCTAVSFAVIVNDKNDNKPTFAESKINVSLEENISIGSKVTTVTANDLDSDEMYGKISYRLTGSGSDDFLIDASTGVITVNRDIDYETRKSYNVSDLFVLSYFIFTAECEKKGWNPVWIPLKTGLIFETLQKLLKEILKGLTRFECTV